LEEEAKTEGRLRNCNEYIREKQGVIYEIKCRGCERTYIVQTKFIMEKRKKQHMQDVRFGREYNAEAKHVRETGHEIKWEGMF
jgi:hypothetical protein